MTKKVEKVSEESSYTTTIKYSCPKRGLVEQIVTVRKFAAQSAPENKIVDSTISDLLNSEQEDIQD